MWIIPDDDFEILFERAALLTEQQALALKIVAESGGERVDVRRIANATGSTRKECTEVLRVLMLAGFVKNEGNKWRFAFRLARRI